MDKNILATKVIEAGGKLSVKSALNPILWLCAIVSVPCLIISLFKKETPFWLIFLIVAPVAMALFGFVYLLLFDRDKLQSEEYQIKKRSLELIQEKGQEAILIDTEITDLDLVENTESIINLESNSNDQ